MTVHDLFADHFLQYRGSDRVFTTSQIVRKLQGVVAPGTAKLANDHAARDHKGHCWCAGDPQYQIFDRVKRGYYTVRSYLVIEDEFALAERSEIDPQVRRSIDDDLSAPAIEGVTAERWVRVRTRAAWKAQEFLEGRIRTNTLHCDRCGFDPSSRVDSNVIRPRSILDVHHKRPLEEGVRCTNISDFDLLCPTCHRIEHLKLNATNHRHIRR
jgi:5-methylcytosine-specific restriction endonuclease McrA